METASLTTKTLIVLARELRHQSATGEFNMTLARRVGVDAYRVQITRERQQAEAELLRRSGFEHSMDDFDAYLAAREAALREIGVR